MMNKKIIFFDRNKYTILIFCFLQLLFITFEKYFHKFAPSQEPILFIIFIYSIYLGYLKPIVINYIQLFLKLFFIIIAISISYVLYSLIYAYIMVNGESIWSEFILGMGYNLTVLGLVILLIIPTYSIGVLIGSIILKYYKFRANK